MPLRLTSLEYFLSRLNLLPRPLFDTPLAPGVAKMLVTACELGLFDVLSKRGLSLEILAEQLGCHPQGLQLLLQILVSAGYLRHRHGIYYNTRMAQRWLTSESCRNIAPYIILYVCTFPKGGWDSRKGPHVISRKRRPILENT